MKTCLWAFTLLTLALATANADTTCFCLDSKRGPEAQCTRESTALFEQIDAEEFTPYECVGDLSLANKASSQAMADTRNAAIASTVGKAGVVSQRS